MLSMILAIATLSLCPVTVTRAAPRVLEVRNVGPTAVHNVEIVGRRDDFRLEMRGGTVHSLDTHQLSVARFETLDAGETRLVSLDVARPHHRFTPVCWGE